MQLAWTTKLLPDALRNLPEGALLMAKALYNARLLAGREDGAEDAVLAELTAKKII